MAKGTTSTSSGNTKSSPAKKSSSSAVMHDEESLLKELFLDELKDIYWAEKHLTKALPKMRKAATSEELANAFETHTAQTQEQITRLEEPKKTTGAVKDLMEVLKQSLNTPGRKRA